MKIALFILICWGLTQILVYGRIFESIRPKHHFFHCPMCVGFWVGLIVFLLGSFSSLFSYEFNIIDAIFSGWLSSGTSYALCTIFGDEGIRYESVHRDK